MPLDSIPPAAPTAAPGAADSKPWWQSRTIWGALIAVIATTASPLVELDGEIQAQLVEICLTLAGVAGSGLAVYGRIKAGRPIAGA